jgi:hypothetical protein
MKNKIVLLSMLIFLSANSYSQEHKLSAGMGLGSTNQILDIFQVVGTGFTAITLNSNYLSQTKNRGEFRLAYAYTPKNRWSYGAAFSYSRSDFDVINQEGKIGEQASSYYTLAAETTYYYMKKEKTKLYGLLGAGATFINMDVTDSASQSSTRSNDSFFNFQITPIGVSYGKNWGGFAEIGVGYRGLFSFGVFVDL